jgi:hypothetical protein
LEQSVKEIKVSRRKKKHPKILIKRASAKFSVQIRRTQIAVGEKVMAVAMIEVIAMIEVVAHLHPKRLRD